MATKFPRNAARHAFSDCFKTAAAPQLSARAQTTSTTLAGTITGSCSDPIATPACCNAPNTKRAALPSINAVSSGFMACNDTRASGCLFRHVTDIDHHYSDVVGLRAGAPVLGPPKHLIKQTLSKLLSRKLLVSRNEHAQPGLSERLAPSVHCLHQPVRVDQYAVPRIKRQFCLRVFLTWPHTKQQSI